VQIGSFSSLLKQPDHLLDVHDLNLVVSGINRKTEEAISRIGLKKKKRKEVVRNAVSHEKPRQLCPPD